MIIKELHIRNIASVENALIEFDKPPLSDSPLFLICGDTGTGKTTILNSICLALYNEVPSLKSIGTSVFDAEGVQTNNPCQLMRKGTGVSSVSLRFEGNDGKHYLAEWDAWRAHKKAAGKIQGAVRILTCEETGIVLKKEQEIKPVVEELTGLDFTKFCRTTLLAQGDFAAFMNGKDNEKVAILEKLTGTEIYARIGLKVHLLCSQSKERKEALENEIKGSDLLSDEQVEAIGQEVAALKAEGEKLSGDLKVADGKLEWIKGEKDLTDKLQGVAADLDKAKTALNSDENKYRMRTLADWDKTGGIRGEMAHKRDLDSLLSHNKKCLEEKGKDFSFFVSGLLWMKSEQETDSANLERIKSRLTDDQPNVRMYNALGEINAYIKTAIDKRAESERLKCVISKADADIVAAQRHLSDSKEELVKTAAQFSERKKLVLDLSKSLEALDFESLSRAVNEDSDKMNATDSAIAAVAFFADRSKELENAAARLKELNEESAKVQSVLSSLNEAVPALRLKWIELDNQLKGQMNLKNSLVELHNVFEKSGKCPLCGTTVEGLHTEEVIDSQIALAKHKAEEAKSALTQATDEFNALSSRLKSLSGDIVSASKDVSAKRGSLLKAESQAVAAVGAFGLKLSSENIVGLLKSLRNDFSRRKEADAKAFSDANLLRKNYDSAKTALDKLADELASKEKVCQSIVDKSSALENDRKISFNSSELALKDVSGALSKLEELVTFTVEWKNVDLAQLRDVISKSAKEYARDKESGEKLALSLADAQKNIDSASSEIEALKHIFPSSVSLAPVSSLMQSASSSVSLVSRGVEVKNLNLSLSAFVTEVRSLTAVIGSTEAQLSGTAEKIRGYLELNPDMSEERLVVLSAISDADASKIRQWLEKLNNAVVGFEAQSAQIHSQLAAHQKIKPMISAEATYDSLSSDRAAVAAAVQLNNEQRVEKETIVKRNAENVAKVAQKKERLDFLRAENGRWNELDSVFGGSDGMRFKRIAQSYVLRALLVKANYYLRQLFNRYELECADGQLAINVIDHAQGNYVRNVSSLSGGESFIVSLALALGLSSINKDKINVDTLFIDEGFGTLSDDYLDSVIDVLDRLYQISGRKVGLISHVSKLRERIPTQIQLTRTGSNSSSVKIVNI